MCTKPHCIMYIDSVRGVQGKANSGNGPIDCVQGCVFVRLDCVVDNCPTRWSLYCHWKSLEGVYLPLFQRPVYFNRFGSKLSLSCPQDPFWRIRSDLSFSAHNERLLVLHGIVWYCNIAWSCCIGTRYYRSDWRNTEARQNENLKGLWWIWTTTLRNEILRELNM